MQYGCIGQKLSHSFSALIHGELAEYEYQLKELAPEELEGFMTAKEFRAINVTIPYKQAAMPYLQHIDQTALAIGAVNTIVNRNGILYGYNTDFYGMKSLILRQNIEIKNKKVLILGSGGTSKTAVAVAQALEAREIYRLSRTEREDCITYETAAAAHNDADVIINTTPMGMFPNVSGAAVSLADYPRVSGVVDAVYNPLRTDLVLAARQRGINAVGGLYMLVAQAAAAVEHFLDTRVESTRIEEVYQALRRDKENIVLIGMPACGKSTVGKILARQTGRILVDTDALITAKAGKPIPEIFAQEGEGGFRDMEAQVMEELSPRQGLIIATGGGAVLRRENVHALRRNGRLYFIDRPLGELMPTDDRPLSKDRAALAQRYKERYDIYCGAADRRVWTDGGAEAVAKIILEDFTK